ncbi:MAG: hypothetical protein JWQ04_908 [Pedosphaera sp.]|nr:hypothetical protein [Pedosphaera sp.]
MQRPYLVKSPLMFLLAGILLATGCASTGNLASRKQERYAAYNALPPEMKTAVDQGRVKPGMNTDAVYIAWGPPSQVVTGGDQTGETTTWIYQGGYVDEERYWGARRLHYAYTPRTYVRAQVVFVNGIVREWRTFPEPVY